MPTIERSAGTPTGYLIAPLCGNGYSGLTKRLDDTVIEAAKLLAAEFGRDVEIRFNSDRRSGGAWLKNSGKGFDGNCQVGLNAGLYKIGANDIPWESSREYREKIEALPDKLVISTYIRASALNDPAMATEGPKGHEPSCCKDHRSLPVAMAWLRKNIKREALRR